MPSAIDGLKFCPRCKQTKPVADFSPDRNPARRDRLQTYCKPCKVEQANHYSTRRYLTTPEAPPDGLKRCPDCQETKPVGEFNIARRNRDGYQNRCRPCSKKRIQAWRARLRANGLLAASNRKANIQKYFNLSLEEYQAIHDAQHGLCAICHNPETGRFRGALRQLAVDHDHATGQRRDLLCSKCNIAIGHMQDSPALLEAAAAYLRRHGKT